MEREIETADEEMVSVVIPTHYRDDNLRAALDSVLEQEWTPLEVVVVDDSGERYAESLVSEYDHVEYVSLEQNRGPQAAREVGFERSTGRYIQFLDDDDRLLPGKLTAQVPVLRDNPDVGVVYCGLRWEGTHAVVPHPDVRGDVLEAALRFSTSPAMMGTMLIERSVIEDITPFRHRHGADDIGMKIELARRTEFDFVEDVYLVRERSEDRFGLSWAAVEGRHEIITIYDGLYEQYPDARRAALGETYLVSGQFRLNEDRWSVAAFADFARALYHVQGYPPEYVGSLVTSLFGWHIYWAVRVFYSKYVLGDDRPGKRT